MKNLPTILPTPLSQLTRRAFSGSALQMLADLERRMERMWDLSADDATEAGIVDYLPACNLTENEENFVVRFDIPGVKKDDIKIELKSNVLYVSGERKSEKEEKSANRYLSESYRGSFSRSFTLPSAVMEGKIDAHSEDGVLTITLPKVEKSKSKLIPVH